MAVPTPRLFDVHAIDDVAAAQGGIVRFAQLVELGMSKSSIARWTRTGGPWQRLLPGVYLVHRGTPTGEERLHAAQQYVGHDSQFTGHAGLHLHGIRAVTEPLDQVSLHLLLPTTRHTQSAAFVTIERTQRVPDPAVIRGFRVAPLPRAIFDAGRRTPNRQATRAFTLEAIQRQLVTVEELRHEIQRGQRQWTAVLREVLDEAGDGVRSVPEAQLRRLFLQSGIREPMWNPRLESATGEFIAEPDAYFKELALALEVDSRKYHFEDARAYENTWRRHERYTRYGIAALRLMPIDIRDRPESVVSSVRATMTAQQGCRLPDLRIVTKGSNNR